MAVQYLVSIQEAELERMIRARSINNKRSIMEHVTSYITHLTHGFNGDESFKYI